MHYITTELWHHTWQWVEASCDKAAAPIADGSLIKWRLSGDLALCTLSDHRSHYLYPLLGWENVMSPAADEISDWGPISTLNFHILPQKFRSYTPSQLKTRRKTGNWRKSSQHGIVRWEMRFFRYGPKLSKNRSAQIRSKGNLLEIGTTCVWPRKSRYMYMWFSLSLEVYFPLTDLPLGTLCYFTLILPNPLVSRSSSCVYFGELHAGGWGSLSSWLWAFNWVTSRGPHKDTHSFLQRCSHPMSHSSSCYSRIF